MSALDDLAEEPRWVWWHYESRGGKPTKVPGNPHGGAAKANDPRTWGTRTEAEAAARGLSNGGGGIGIQLGDLDSDQFLGGLDLDSCLDEDGTVAPWAEAIVNAVPSYTERSPSGRGLKVFFISASEDVRPFLNKIGVASSAWGTRRGVGPNSGDHGPAVEVYFALRFFAVTGDIWPHRDRIACMDAEALARLTALIPAPRKANGTSEDRSAAAFRIAIEMRREGRTFEEFCEALRNDPVTSSWVKEKGQAFDNRELRRAWERAAALPPDIAELNQTFAVIRVANRVVILNEHLDPEGKATFSLLSPAGFKLLLANRVAVVAGRRVSLANYWICDSARRQFEGITFAPHCAPGGFYNLWRGYAFDPNPNGSCEKFKAHLRHNVCRGSEGLFNWVFGWFADIFQHPETKCGTALVLRGPMGVGKTIVGDTFGQLLGAHYVQVADPRFVTGRFNAHLVSCLLFHLDEAFWAGDHVAEGKLKDLITGKRHPIELKGYEVFFVPNYVRVFINGNADWIVPAGVDERRMATLDVGEDHKQDVPYSQSDR